jgi:hypothetical protein
LHGRCSTSTVEMREDLSFCCSHTLNLYTNGIEVWPSSSLVVVPFLHKWISRFPFQTGASQFTSATSILGTKNGERARGRSKYLGAPSVTPPIQSPEVRSNASPAASPPRRPPLRCLPRHANASPASASAYGPHATCTVPHPTPRPRRQRRHAAAVHGLRIVVPRSRDATRHLLARPPRQLPGRPVSSYPASPLPPI